MINTGVAFQERPSGQAVDLHQLQTAYAAQKQEATRLAGDLLDIPRRGILLDTMYRDSGGNHVFPQLAAHGALWAYRFFEVGGRLGRMIAYRYFYHAKERAYRLGLLDQFAEGFRQVNRQVFIDTWTNYHFAAQYGQESGADQIIQPSLLQALNQVHDARVSQASLSEAQKRAVFEQSFHWEQELTVAPGVQQAIEHFDCPIMIALCTKPIVRFAYFPRMKYMWFKNFADKQERIDKGMRAADLAFRVGWDAVRTSLKSYRLLPAEYWSSPQVVAARLRNAADPI